MNKRAPTTGDDPLTLPGSAARRTAPTRALRALYATGAILTALSGPVAAEENCRQALVFALDVSGSVDEDEYRQQLEGLAGAITDGEVQDAILAGKDYPMAVAAFEWSSASYSALIVDWTFLRTEADVGEVATRLRAWPRRSAPKETGIGAGLQAAAALLERGPECWEMTIDVSADGKNNDGPPPMQVHADGVLQGATVNALVVGSTGGPDDASAALELEGVRSYLEEHVVGAGGGFIAVANSYNDYLLAMRRKLLREIAAAPAPLEPAVPETPAFANSKS